MKTLKSLYFNGIGGKSWEPFLGASPLWMAIMADTKNLELRGKTWWVHLRIAPSLRPLMKKGTLRKSLGTSDLAEAHRRRPQGLADLRAMMNQARDVKDGRVDVVASRAKSWRTEPMPASSPLESQLHEDQWHRELHQVTREFGADEATRFAGLVDQRDATPIDHFIEQYQTQTGTTPKTKAEQREAIQRFIAWNPKLRLETLTGKIAGQYIQDGLATAKNRSGGPLTPATKNKQLSCLSTYWNWLLRYDKVTTNPWARKSFSLVAKGDRVNEAKERPFTDEELQALFDGPADPRLRVTMTIALLSGMRIDEICSLRVADCCDGIFNITRAKTRAGIRKVPIHSKLVTLVNQRCVGKRPDEFLIHELGLKPKSGSLRNRATPVVQQFTRYRRDVGVDATPEGKRRSLVTFHSFRRWFTTQAERAGQPPWVIEAVVGHARSGMSLGLYSQGPSPEQLRMCVEAVTSIHGADGGRPLQPRG